MSESSSSSDSSSSSGSDSGGGSYDSGSSHGGHDTSGWVGGHATGDVGDGWPQPYPQADPHQQFDPYTPYSPAGPAAHHPRPVPYSGHPGHPHAGHWPAPIDEGPKNQAVASLAVNIILTLLCCAPLSIAGIVVSALAISRGPESPESARTLVKWSWGLAIGSVVLAGALLVTVVIAGFASSRT